MSRRILITLVLFVLSLTGGLGAATVWESKPFNTWTDAELNNLLTGSPWAGPGSLSRLKADGTLAKTGDAVVISWTTALPMRQAIARERIGLNGPITKDVEAFLAEPLPMFLVAVKVTGSPEARSLAARAGTSQLSTRLIPRDKSAIIALQAEGHLIDATGKILPDGSANATGSLLVFAFPRNSGISIRDREVEFVSQLDDFAVKRTFHVNEMIYNGKLEL